MREPQVLTDEELAEVRRGVEEAQEDMRAYSPIEVHKAAHFNAVSEFDRICASMYVFEVVPDLLATVESVRAEMRQFVEALAEYATRKRYADPCEWCGNQGQRIESHLPDCIISRASAWLASHPSPQR